MILHLFDDEKVVERCISFFDEALPGQNVFLVKIIKTPKYVKPATNIVFINSESQSLDINIKDVDKVVIHLLNQWKIDFINYYKLYPKQIYWSVWGHDMYNSLLAYLGYSIYYEPFFINTYFKDQVLAIMGRLGVLHPILRKRISFIRKRISFLITSSEEFYLQKKYLGKNLPASLVEHTFIYYSIDDILGDKLKGATLSGSMIMVGNSCSFSNNHSYAFKFLSKLDLTGRKVFVPLSYGGNSRYQSHIINTGKKLFKDSFYPLTVFIPLEDYNKYLLKSSVCIYGNWRQEAVGNILVSLYLGAKVFLSEKSPLLAEYRKMGLHVYTLEKITQYELDNPLTIEHMKNNRDIIYGLMNRQAIVNKIKSVFG